MKQEWKKRVGAGMLMLGLLYFPVLARTGDITVSDEGGEICGSSAVYQAQVNNQTSDEAKPVMVLVWYEDGTLKEVKISAQTISAGESAEMSVCLSDVTVTDQTKITGYVLEDKLFAVPVSVSEIECLGNNSTAIEEFRVVGAGDARVQLDDENKTIEVMLPLYQKTEGGVSTVGNLQVAAVTAENEKSTVKIGDITLNGTGKEKTGEVSLEEASSVTVVAEDGTAAEYALSCVRYLCEDFEENSVFSDEMLIGDPSKTGAWKNEKNGLAQGDAAQYFSTTWIGNANEYSQSVSIGVLPISEAHSRDGATMETGASGAAGRAIRISKTRSTGSESGNALPLFWINGNAFRGAKSEIVLEYDIAMDYTRVTEGRVGCLGGGIRYFGTGTDQYNIFDNTNVTMNELSKVGNLAITQGGTLFTANGQNGKPDCPPDSWHHVKTVITMPEKLATSYIDGKQISAAFDATSIWNDNILISFQTSGLRSLDLWADNILITCK